MNIIEHLTRTVTPIVLGNNAADTNRVSLLERVYAIIVSRLADNDVYNRFANTTITNEDHGFFDRLLPETTHRSTMTRELAGQFNVPEQETQSLISRAAPLVYNELRSLAGTTPLTTFLGSHLSTIGSSLPTWSYALIPAGVLGAMKLNDTTRVNTTTTPVTQTVTRTEEHLVATPKKEDNGGLMKMLLPLIGLLILGALAWALLKSCNKTEPVTTTTVVSSTTSSTTQVTPVAVETASAASANSATVMASSVTINNNDTMASAPTASVTTTDTTAAVLPTATDTTTTTTTTISSTEPSVVFENGRLSFYFATGKADVAGNAKEKANDILEAAKQGKKIGISGYTDSTGNAAANAKLAKDRAQAVKSFLVANGVPASQLDLRKPDDSIGAAGKDQEGRRVDAYIIDDNAIPATTDATTTTTTVVASPAK